MCLEPKYMAGAIRNWNHSLRRNSPMTPTLKPGSSWSWSQLMNASETLPSSSVTVTGPAFMNSMSCRWVPTWMPKWKERRSVYGRYCTFRSWPHMPPVASRESNTKMINLLRIYNKTIQILSYCLKSEK